MFTPEQLFVFTIFVALCTNGYAAPVNETSQENKEDVKIDENSLDAPSYLSQFGYLPAADPNKPSQLITNEALASAIRDFQKFMGLEQTGELNSETKKQMVKPRCGIKDPAKSGPDGPNSYKLLDSRWKRQTLFYKITQYPSNFPRDKTDSTIREAFNVWSRVTPLRFVRKRRGPVHMDIKFRRGYHGNCGAFDGPHGVLAHAFSPRGGGDIHFDDTEHWTINSYRGTNLLQTAAHEIGHALGLDHSDRVSALMYPTILGYDPNFQLDSDDVRGIQRLYPI